MGNLGMFYGKEGTLGAMLQEHQRRMDRFLAGTSNCLASDGPAE